MWHQEVSRSWDCRGAVAGLFYPQLAQRKGTSAMEPARKISEQMEFTVLTQNLAFCWVTFKTSKDIKPPNLPSITQCL